MRAGVRGTLILILAQAVQGLSASGARAEDVAASQPSASQPAETDEEQSFDPAANRQPMHLNIADLWVGMGSDYEYRKVRSPSGYRSIFAPRTSFQEDTSTQLSEMMGISLAGDIYDPNLVDYRAQLQFGLDQAFYRRISNFERDSDRSSGTLSQWDVSADILKSKPLSFNVYTRRADIRVPRRFLPSLHELETEAGASALAITGPVTTELGFSYRDEQTHGNRLEQDNESVQLSRFYGDSKWAISDNQSLHLTFDHEREKDDYQGSRYRYHTNRDELRIDHELAFGSDNQHHFDTFLRWDAENGELGRDEFEISPRLTLQHTEKFKTIYRYDYFSFEQDAIDLDQHKFDAEAIYQATRELRLGSDVYAIVERYDQDIDTNQEGITGDATYQKSSSLGDFSANLNLGYDQARTEGHAGRNYVRNEAHAMVAVRPVILRERNILMSSVLAHDSRFTKLYVAGVDFIVTKIQEQVVVTRVPWGRIAEGDVVYFDYAYDVPADSRLNTYRVDFRIEHTFKFGLTPYYYYEGRFQEVDNRSYGDPLYRDNQNRSRLGLRYGKPLWTVTGEYEFFDDTVEPYDAFHLTGQASLFRSLEHTLDLNSELSRYWFEGGYDRRNVWFTDINVKDRYQLSNYLSLTGGAEYRHEHDSVRGTTEGIDIEAGLQYTRGALTVELNVEYDLLNIVQSRDHGFGIFLNVKRDLSHLIPPNLRGGQQ